MKKSCKEFLLLLLIAFLLTAFCYTVFAQASFKILVKVKGKVECKKGSEDKWKQIFSQRPVADNDEARTLESSEGKLLLPGGNVVRMYENTSVQIGKIEMGDASISSQVKQNAGKVLVEVKRATGKKQKFEVQTPTAVLAVRGSVFYSEVGVDGGTKAKAIIDPLEVTAQGKTVICQPGFVTTVQPGMQPINPFVDPNFAPPGGIPPEYSPGNTGGTTPPGGQGPSQPPVVNPGAEPTVPYPYP